MDPRAFSVVYKIMAQPMGKQVFQIYNAYEWHQVSDISRCYSTNRSWNKSLVGFVGHNTRTVIFRLWRSDVAGRFNFSFCAVTIHKLASSS